MPRRQIILTAEERQALLDRRDHASLPYMRERAAALLKVAGGMPAAAVARHGLLRPREPDTVSAWLDRYHAAGLAGLTVRTGRGRKPAFSPAASNRSDGPGGPTAPLPARPAGVRGEPHPVDLGDLARGLPVAERLHAGWGQRVLKRLKLVWKRPRAAIRSPDPDSDAKRADVAAAVAQACATPGLVVAVYLDERTIARQPTLAHAPQGHAQARALQSHHANTLQGHAQARALQSHHANTETRVVAALDTLTGRVLFQRAAKITVAVLVHFYQALMAAYPEAEHLYVIQDNWPVHTHPGVLFALSAQQTRWPWYRPPSWPSTPGARALKKWGHLQLPIQIVPLPTSASWCNPIEKLWRTLRQETTHLHRWADDLTALRTHVDHFLDQFAHGSSDLMRYVGLQVSD